MNCERELPINLCFRAFAILLLTVTLAACKSGGDESSAGSDDVSDSVKISPPPSDNSILSSFFVESFDAFEAVARRLIEESPRYVLQHQSWYFDRNGNGNFDPETEHLYDTYPLHSSGVHFAHAAGLTGAGQIIAITDDGFLSNHEAFAHKTISEAGSLSIEDHGTFVASVAAGNSTNMIGMAPGADLAFGSFATFETRAQATRLAEHLGAVAQNNSWGFVNAPISQSSFDSVFTTATSHDYLAALHSYAQSGVVIFAASNNPTDAHAGLMPALPLLEPGLEPGWIAVINGDADMDGDDVVAARRVSAACVEAAAWCLAAEGTWIGAAATSTTSYDFGTGTSFAAPMVAGAMAILGEAFPQMSPHELRIRLLASADNSFAGFDATGQVELVSGFFHTISDEWGHGFLDVKAALLPIGETTATMADGSSYNITEPLAVEGAATGDAVARALQNVALVVDDAFAAQFSLPANQLVSERGQTALSDVLQREWASGTRSSCCGISSYFPETQILGFQSEEIMVSLMIPSGLTVGSSFGVTMGRAFDSDFGQISTRVSLGQDGGALLPQWYSGGDSVIIAGELGLTSMIGNGVELLISAGYGSTLFDSRGRSSSANFNSASVAVSRRNIFASADRLSISVGLPVAVSTGAATVTLPVTTLNGATQFQAINVDLAPAEREVRFGINYTQPIGESSEIVFSAARSENFGNVASRHRSGLFLGFQTHF